MCVVRSIVRGRVRAPHVPNPDVDALADDAPCARVPAHCTKGRPNAGPRAEFYRHMRVVGYGAFAIG
jgi:hypothetical protein